MLPRKSNNGQKAGQKDKKTNKLQMKWINKAVKVMQMLYLVKEIRLSYN